MLLRPTLALKNSNIKCFKCLGKGHIDNCPNKRSTIIQDDGIVDSASSIDESSSISDSNASSEYSPNDEGDLLIRENIFHLHCHILGQLFSIIIDGDSSVNVAISSLVEKPKLPTLAHPRPYKLQWLNDEGELVVTKQVFLSFTLGKYEDKMLCDVVPMEVTHILLGRTLQYDCKVTHDSNRFSFVTIKPLSPKDVNEDQVKMKLRREKEKKVKREDRKNEGEKRKEDGTSKGTEHPKDHERPKDRKRPMKKMIKQTVRMARKY
ncbi:hypothetical protein CR513_47508, partial [Mucuna pruriens]